MRFHCTVSPLNPQRIHAHVNTFRMGDAGPYICRVHNVLKKYIFSSWCIVTVNRVNNIGKMVSGGASWQYNVVVNLTIILFFFPL